MPKINLTKSELKNQRDSLKRFDRYLPMLQLKKQQLQVEIDRANNHIAQLNTQINAFQKEVNQWVDVFAENIDLLNLIKLKQINTDTGNIAGIDIPLFVSVDFQEQGYDYLIIPLWVDQAIEVLKQIINQKARRLIFQKQRLILQEELRITTQRVNLFEKVKIPEAKENIRVIQIHLGDLQTAGVVRGKIAKAKIEQRRELVSL
ncbi:MAG: V-type ATP synthase subunit D [Candidatus Omnitrophota bacterium]|jgi:V/A-type H+-transporting ATPase subunit D